jgi:glutamate formiminotransferase/formiminotetrahydrofolate cyclodeaminase
VPLECAQVAAKVAELAAAVAERGNTNAASDAAVAGLMAEAACKGAALNVKINVASYDAADAAAGAQLLAQANAAIATASDAAGRAVRAADASISGSAG